MPKKNLYSVHPSISYAQTGMRTIEKNTGKTIALWETFIKKNGSIKQAYRYLRIYEEGQDHTPHPHFIYR